MFVEGDFNPPWFNPAMPPRERAFDSFPPAVRTILREAMAATMRDGEPLEIELPLLARAGAASWVRIYAVPTMRDGRCVEISGAAQDISDRKQLELEVVAATNQERARIGEDRAIPLTAGTWLGDAGEVGELVIAVGNPFGLTQTVTMGIISAVGRANMGIVDYEDFIQTDAAINPGNSGGALANLRGELIGINTAIFSQNGGNMGIGFAIPSTMAKSVFHSLVTHGKVVRGWIGVSIQEVTPDLAKQFGTNETTGALVADVLDDSPASKANFERGDIVMAYNGIPVRDPAHLRALVADTAPGTTVHFSILREKSQKDLSVKIEELPKELAKADRKSVV